MDDVAEQTFVTVDHYESDRTEVVGIVRFESLPDLRLFQEKLSAFTDHVESHLILEQMSLEHTLSPSERCQPCVVHDESLADEVGEREHLACTTCGAFVVPGDKTRRLRVELSSEDARRERFARQFKVACVGMQFDEQGLMDLGAFPDARGRSDTNPFGEDAWWRESRTVAALGDRIAQEVFSGMFADAQIVVLPEYCVPLPALRIIENALRDYKPTFERFLVLGTHLSTRGTNRAAILHIHDGKHRWWFQHKNDLATPEVDANIRRGNGTLVFQSSFGTIEVVICKDGYRRQGDYPEDVDLLLMPSFHRGGDDSLPDPLRNIAGNSAIDIVFANGHKGPDTENPSDRSFIAGPGVDQDSLDSKGGAIRVGERRLDLTVVQGTIDPRARDLVKAGVRLEGRRQPHTSVRPLHVDFWSDADRAAYATELQEKLTSFENDPKRGRGDIHDFWTLDWEDAEIRWRESPSR